MTAKDKITKAKVQLILSEPFFATIALKMRYKEDANYPTAYTDGREIGYNPDFIDSLQPDQVKGLIIHEVMHIAQLHHLRRGGRDPHRWNQAADYAINQLIVDAGHSLPEGGLIDAKYKGLSAEQIFPQLPAPQPQGKEGDGQSGKGNGQQQQRPQPFGEVIDAPTGSEAERQQIEAETKQLIAQAAQVAKQQGKLPAGLKRMIDETLEAAVDWRAILQQFVFETCRNDYTFRKPNPRYLQSGFYMPVLQNEEPGNITLIVDTSGSIDNQLLNKFGAEIKELTDSLHAGLNVLYVDCKLQGVQEFDRDDDLILNPKGGGGTDFRPGFEHLEKEGQEPAAVVYFTDGYCNSFPETPEVPVLWAVYNNNDFDPPFGEVVKIK